MKLQSITLALLCSGMGFFLSSCEKNDATLQPKDALTAVASSNATATSSDVQVNSGLLKGVTLDCSFEAYTQAVLNGYSSNAVLPSACSPTALDGVVSSYVQPFGALERQWYSTLATLNQYYSYVDTSTPYFGVNGELTQVATKYKRDLESFWNMPNEVDLHGQHTANLQNRDAIATAYIELVGRTTAVAYANADFLIANVVTPSTVFKTTPLLSFDGFATTGGSTATGKVIGNLIVIGDGILQAMTATSSPKWLSAASWPTNGATRCNSTTTPPGTARGWILPSKPARRSWKPTCLPATTSPTSAAPPTTGKARLNSLSCSSTSATAASRRPATTAPRRSAWLLPASAGLSPRRPCPWATS
ncbi:MAG TPA: hypothetical protein VF629_10200 [Hymenobacter sp.]|uniref:hypothetical protein n=1 Tax=Hymenobacter sp. TaxID=1898978 RepID=UPI002ED80D9F